MDILSCVVGHWYAEARVQEVGTGKLMAIISATDSATGTSGRSRHTAVFDHRAGQDMRLETEAVVQHIFYKRYGV